MNQPRDHGGGLDAAIDHYGGLRSDWIDLSTGINPVPYPIGDISSAAWTALPDTKATDRLISAARQFWHVPDHLEILAAPGASALIAQMPRLWPTGSVRIDAPTYNEHGAAFAAQGWQMVDGAADVRVIVHPNNPDGALWSSDGEQSALIVDESFCDTDPDHSVVPQAKDDTVILKSFGKFWGLAGIRLGFAIARPDRIDFLRDALGPWPVAGPALEIGARALADASWADQTRTRLKADAARLDTLMTRSGAHVVGGTSLFRLYDVADAKSWQDRLARHHIWSRVFPYSSTWLRLGIPAEEGWARLEGAL